MSLVFNLVVLEYCFNEVSSCFGEIRGLIGCGPRAFGGRFVTGSGEVGKGGLLFLNRLLGGEGVQGLVEKDEPIVE